VAVGDLAICVGRRRGGLWVWAAVEAAKTEYGGCCLRG
jgi:hypothetical protein